MIPTGVDASGGTCGATGCDESFSYDVNGNRTMTGYTTGTGNRLTADGTYTYTYDDNGNMLQKSKTASGEKTEFTWDYRNRLTQVLVKDSSNNILQQSDYTHDTFNRRIIKTHDPDGPGPNAPTVVKTIYDGALFAASAYADFDGNNALAMRFLFGPGVDFIVARRDTSGSVAWYLTDHLGTIRDLVNTSGALLDHLSYTAFGQLAVETSPPNGDRFKYTGREYDSETAQYYYRARFYDPDAGRFISSDPISFTAGDENLYRYVRNESLTNEDPTGLWSYAAHLQLLSAAFPKEFTAAELKEMAKIGRNMDTSAMIRTSENYQHFMIPPGQTAQEAFVRAEEFVNAELKLAALWKMRAEAAKRDEAEDHALKEMRRHLARAFHTIMDSTSPAHVDSSGRPVAYSGANKEMHSVMDKVGIETTKHLTEAIIKKNKEMMEKAYECFKTGADFEFETPKF